MKIYLDVVFFINFAFDFLLLLGVSILLRRNVSIKRMVLGGLIGGLSIFILFFEISSFQLFLLKVIISIIMILVSFSYKNLEYTLKNFFYLYTESMILGGVLYYLNNEFSYKQEGLVFYHNGLSINFIFLIIFSPIIIYTYVRQVINLKNNYSNYYMVDIYAPWGILKVNGFLDTGNRLEDPYTKRPIMIINHKLWKEKIDKCLLVPIHTISDNYLLKCVSVDKINIKGIGIKKNVLIGLTEKEIKMEGIDCILQPKLMEE